MKGIIIALLVAATRALALPQEAPPSEQLLETLESVPSSDPPVQELEQSIESSRETLDKTTSSKGSPSWIACQLLKIAMPKYYTDTSTSQSSYDTLRLKNWFVYHLWLFVCELRIAKVK